VCILKYSLIEDILGAVWATRERRKIFKQHYVDIVQSLIRDNASEINSSHCNDSDNTRDSIFANETKNQTNEFDRCNGEISNFKSTNANEGMISFEDDEEFSHLQGTTLEKFCSQFSIIMKNHAGDRDVGSLQNLNKLIRTIIRLHVQEFVRGHWSSDVYMNTTNDDIARQLDQPARKIRYILTSLLPYVDEIKKCLEDLKKHRSPSHRALRRDQERGATEGEVHDEDKLNDISRIHREDKSNELQEFGSVTEASNEHYEVVEQKNAECKKLLEVLGIAIAHSKRIQVHQVTAWLQSLDAFTGIILSSLSQNHEKISEDLKIAGNDLVDDRHTLSVPRIYSSSDIVALTRNFVALTQYTLVPSIEKAIYECAFTTIDT